MKGGLGNMPLTLFVLVAGVILYLHVRRASLGIDTHPGEGRAVTVKPRVFIGPPAPGVSLNPATQHIGPAPPPPPPWYNWQVPRSWLPSWLQDRF